MSSSFSGSIHGGSVKFEDIIERESNFDEDEDGFSSSDEESVVDDRPYEERAPWEVEQEEEREARELEKEERRKEEEERWYDGRPTRRAASKTERLNYGPRVPIGEPPKPENYFLEALRVAAEEYNDRLLLVSERQFSSFEWTPVQPVDPDIIEEEPEATTIEDFSDDEEMYDDRVGPKLTPSQAASLLYKPLGPWAKFSNLPIENSKVVYHLSAGAMCEATIRQGTLGGQAITYISKTWPLDQEWRGFFSELTLYQHPEYLAPLQGSVVPRIIGVYLLPNKISIAMELPHSDFWIEASHDMPDILKRRCISAFDKIHAQGVLHNDPELRHMLIDADGRVTIIDFQESRALKPIPHVNLKECDEDELSIERRQVLYKLNYQGARTIENQRRVRVYKRLERNEERQRRRERASGFWGRKEIVSDDEEDDPEDIANPVVEPQIWMDLWVSDEECMPTCFVVPGKEPEVVNEMLVGYARAILNTLKKEKEARQRAEAADKRAKTSGEKRARDDSAGPSSPTHTPPPPADPVDKDVESFRAEKRRAIDTVVYDDLLASDGTLTANLASVLNPVDVISSLPLSDAEKTFAISLLDGAPVKGNEELHIPYEGYKGLDGSTDYAIPNSYPSKLVAQLRKDMIRQDNITRCEAEGLQRRIEPGNILTRKKKSTHVSFGGLKRAREDLEEPEKAWKESLRKKRRYFKKRGLPLEYEVGEEGREEGGEEEDESDEDKENDEPSGPKILTVEELDAEQEALASEDTPSPSPSNKGKAPMKSILRRNLSLEERIRLAAHDEVIRRLYPPVEDDDEEVECKFGKNGTSGFRTSTSPKRSRPQLQPLSPATTTTATSHTTVPASLASSRTGELRTPSPLPQSSTSSSPSSSSSIATPESKTSTPAVSEYTVDPWMMKVDATWNPVLPPPTLPNPSSPKKKKTAFAVARREPEVEDDESSDDDEEDGEESRPRFVPFGCGEERPRRRPKTPPIPQRSTQFSSPMTPLSSSPPNHSFDPVPIRGSTASTSSSRDNTRGQNNAQQERRNALGVPNDRRFRIGVGAASPSPMKSERSGGSPTSTTSFALQSSPSLSTTTLRRTNASESIVDMTASTGPSTGTGTRMDTGTSGTSFGAYSSSNDSESNSSTMQSFSGFASSELSCSGSCSGGATSDSGRPISSGEQMEHGPSRSTGKRKRASGTGDEDDSGGEDNDGSAGAAGAKRRDLGKSSARDLGNSVPRGSTSGGGAGVDIAVSAGDRVDDDLKRESTVLRASAKAKGTKKRRKRTSTSDTAASSSDSENERVPLDWGFKTRGPTEPEDDASRRRRPCPTGRNSFSLFGMLRRWL